MELLVLVDLVLVLVLLPTVGPLPITPVLVVVVRRAVLLLPLLVQPVRQASAVQRPERFAIPNLPAATAAQTM